MLEPGVALGRNGAEPQRTAGGRTRRSWGWLSAGLSLLLGMLFAVPFAYWRLVNTVPVVPRPPAPPVERNGLVQAIGALNAIPAAAYGREPEAVRYSRVAPMLAQTRAAFRQEWSVWRPAGPPLDTGHVPALARFLALESRVRRERGDLSGALSSALDAFELGLNLSAAGGLQARYAGWSCAEYGLAEVEALYSELPAQGIEQQFSRVRRLRSVWPKLADILERERPLAKRDCCLYLEEVSRMRLRQRLDRHPGNGVKTGSQRWNVRLYGWRVWKDVLTPHGALVTDVDRYYREMAEVARRGGSPARLRTVPGPSHPLAGDFPSSHVSITGYREWPELSLALLEGGMAARLYRLRKSRYPRIAAELPLPSLPGDLWKQPLRYRLVSGRPAIYSLGPDGKDNGGRAISRQASIAGRVGDLVFGRLSERAWRKH